ncbi:MAG: hypothetical protein ABI704_25125 [Kofleriaceae bacterium]
MKLAFVSVLLGACTSLTGGGGTDPVGSAAGGSAAPTPKKGGFSASLTAEKEGPAVVPATKAGSDSKAAVTDVKPDPAIKPATIAPDPKSTEFGTKNDGNHNSVPEPLVSTEAAPSRPSDKRAHVEPGPALGAIKLDMEPNWDRDYETAGTISFVLKVPNSTDTRVFNFHYGYDLSAAPTDREAYKKYLADQKVLNVTLDRQRGAAWYLEGTDGTTNNPAFRMEVTYGGKRLVCYGSLYKDKESTAFGPDLRDKVVNAAKKICETLAL